MEHQNISQNLLPFLNWAGGKRWLTKHPAFFDIKYDRYIEPFLGSGAIFFRLCPTKAILSDSNSDLIEAYSAIKEDWQRVHRNLKRHSANHSDDYYYDVRASHCRNKFTRAAKFIYLNRTCWNGLYRVNLEGRFNVPVGTKKNVLLPTDDFETVAKRLRKVKLVACDFECTIAKAGCGDFVFVDPPYTVKHNHNGFVKYNESMFSWDDQLRLRDSVELGVSRGAKVLVTNACHDSVRNIYRGVGKITKLKRASVISGKASSRGKYNEMIVECF